MAASAAASGRSEAEREALVDHLHRTGDLFLGSLEAVTAGQAAWRPGQDRWSILEVAEHVAASEESLRQLVVAMLAEPAPAELLEGAAIEGRVRAMIVDRGSRFEAPEPVRPTGRWGSLAEIAEAFQAARAATLRILEGPGDLRLHAAEHPAFGNLDAVGWLYLLSGHAERHALQVDEIQATAGYPGG